VSKGEIRSEEDVPIIEACELTSGPAKIAPFCLKLYKGEVVGFSGLLGSGEASWFVRCMAPTRL
jgi:ABC-type sugar transport system ATPase subunit